MSRRKILKRKAQKAKAVQEEQIKKIPFSCKAKKCTFNGLIKEDATQCPICKTDIPK